MNEIEELMRTHLKDAEQQPPEGTWDEIAQRMDGAAPAASKRASVRHIHLRRPVWIAVAATAIYLAVSSPNTVTDNQQTSMLQGSESPVVPVVVDSIVDEEMPIASVYIGPLVKQSTNVVEDTSEPVAVSTKEIASATQSRRLPPDYVFPSELFDFDTTEWVESDESVKEKPTVVDGETDKPIVTSRKNSEKKEMPYISIPNILTPNGDGANDCWVIPDLEQYGQVQVRIYTARRQKVYTSNGYNNDFCGAGLPDGNYFYEMAFRDYSVVRRGVLVIKH